MARNVILCVILRYKESKAWKNVIHTLMQDLNSLKYPLPKMDNVSRVGSGTWLFFWPSTTGSVLHHQLELKTSETRPLNDDYQTLLDELSVDNVRLQIKPVPKDKPAPNLKRSNPFTSQQPQKSQISSHEQGSRNGLSSNAQTLPGEIDEAPRPSKIPKLEPVDSVPLPSWRDDSIASSVPSLQSQTSPQISFSAKPATPPPVSPLSALPAQEAIVTDLPPPVPSQPKSPSSSTAPMPPSISRLPSGSSGDISSIQRLTRELWDVRRQIAAVVARETALIGELQALHAGPEIEASGSELVSQSRLQAMERDLAEEQRKRMEAEQALQDIERERKEPFVVPELLQAFIMISKLTTRALG